MRSTLRKVITLLALILGATLLGPATPAQAILSPQHCQLSDTGPGRSDLKTCVAVNYYYDRGRTQIGSIEVYSSSNCSSVTEGGGADAYGNPANYYLNEVGPYNFAERYPRCRTTQNVLAIVARRSDSRVVVNLKARINNWPDHTMTFSIPTYPPAP